MLLAPHHFTRQWEDELRKEVKAHLEGRQLGSAGKCVCVLKSEVDNSAYKKGSIAISHGRLQPASGKAIFHVKAEVLMQVFYLNEIVKGPIIEIGDHMVCIQSGLTVVEAWSFDINMTDSNTAQLEDRRGKRTVHKGDLLEMRIINTNEDKKVGVLL